MNWPDDYLIPGIEPYHVEEAGIIYCGRAEDILRRLPSGSIDLTVTSPPYDSIRDYNGYSYNFEKIATGLMEVTCVFGSIVWIVGDETVNGSETGTSFKQALHFKEIGFNLHDTMIYEKETISYPDTVRYYNCFEFMFILSKGKPKTINLIADRKNKYFGGQASGTDRGKDGSIRKMYKKPLKEFGPRRNIWPYLAGFMHSTKDKFVFDHPAIFPEELATDHIVSWSNPGDIVMDCHLGSGTVAKQAKELGRKFIGIEISEEYCAIAVKRLRQGVLNFG